MSLKPTPGAYVADSFDGVEHIPEDSLMALDKDERGRGVSGFRLMFGKNWAGNHQEVHIFLTEEDAMKLARKLFVGTALHGKVPHRAVVGDGVVPYVGQGVGNEANGPLGRGPGQEDERG